MLSVIMLSVFKLNSNMLRVIKLGSVTLSDSISAFKMNAY
jgi:hypothetical protein